MTHTFIPHFSSQVTSEASENCIVCSMAPVMASLFQLCDSHFYFVVLLAFIPLCYLNFQSYQKED